MAAGGLRPAADSRRSVRHYDLSVFYCTTSPAFYLFPFLLTPTVPGGCGGGFSGAGPGSFSHVTAVALGTCEASSPGPLTRHVTHGQALPERAGFLSADANFLAVSFGERRIGKRNVLRLSNI